tara:strand:- start:643 stop:1089 length:447 start_codon:yes stop_codon:yes gene_type:complete
LAIIDTQTTGSFVEDRDENVFIGLDLPISHTSTVEGYFRSTRTTIDAVKNNIRSLLSTTRGERLMQPNLGTNFKKILFEPITDDTKFVIEDEIVQTFNIWLPFVQVRGLDIVPFSDGNFNSVKINLAFSIVQDPNTLESIELQIDNKS